MHPDGRFYLAIQKNHKNQKKILNAFDTGKNQILMKFGADFINFINQIEDIKYSQNGFYVLLISYSTKQFWIIKLGKKNEIKFSYKSKTGFSMCDFDNFSQNVILISSNEMVIYSLRMKQIVETIDLNAISDTGFKPLKGFIESKVSDKIILYSVSEIIEID